MMEGKNKEGVLKKTKRLLHYCFGTFFIILFILFAYWAGWGWLFLLPIIVDYFFLKKINWTWFRKIKNPFLREIISWLDAILFAVVGVTLLNIYFFQNFAIPTSSLEKTLYVGDYLFVSKLSYGPRMPMTPLSLPLVHNSINGGKSYLDSPSFSYKRLKGFGKVERNDLVVFNFPAGDTVATKMPNPDYYTLKFLYGDEYIRNNPEVFGNIIYRPIDKRDHYVKRCVGLPGEVLELRENDLYINGKKQKQPKFLQFNYFVLVQAPGFFNKDFEELGVSVDDRTVVLSENISSVLKELDTLPKENIVCYHIPMTNEMLNKVKKDPRVLQVLQEKTHKRSPLYPLELNKKWTRDSYGPIMIPKKGMIIRLNETNYELYKRCIVAYEGHTLEENEEGVFILDGRPQKEYKFSQDYYFMMGDNRHNSADSRYWGFVPEDHIVGKPYFLWLSLDKYKKIFDGKIRWGRMFKLVDKY